MPNSPISVCDIRGSNESAELPTAPLATENVGVDSHPYVQS